MRRRGLVKKNSESGENIFWITMTDLLLGLAIVFMTLFILAMTGFTQNKIVEQNTQSQVAQELAEVLESKNIDAEIDKLTGQVKISDLELFELNSYKLSDVGKTYLDEFLPVYIETVFSNPKLAEKITNIVIQGHTDSQSYAGVETKEAQFTKNMELSLKRANSIAEYLFKTNYDKKYSDLLTKILVVEGKSFTEPILVDGIEDYDKSRRVELELIVKNSNFQDYLIGK